MDRNFGPTEQILWPVSVFSGIIMCKIVYEITGQVSVLYFKGYNKLSKSQKIEWNNRGFSTFHAIVAAAVSFYLLVLSDTFKEGNSVDLLVNRKSVLSDAMFGISLGYFLADLGMILWLFPSLGGKEYIFHHALSMYSFLLALISGKGHLYILMVLFSEITTPFVNLRWYLDLAGQKSSMLYIYNGVALFLGWLLKVPLLQAWEKENLLLNPWNLHPLLLEKPELFQEVARILLFIYFFIHMYLHFDQVKTIFPLGFYSILLVPSLLSVMNVLWFRKIMRGMIKTLSRKRREQ